ncbi:ubiquitin carboxyl-terminal hydrolase 2 [Rhypophila decipiens]
MSATRRSYTEETGGRLASLAIDDWLSGHLDEWTDFKCPELRRPTARHPSEPGTSHDLIVVPSQTNPGPGTQTWITSMCRYCRYHFIFTITTDTTSSDLTDKHPMHHFIRRSAPGALTPTTDKLYPLESITHFQCSYCSTKVTIEVSSPRLKPDWVDKLLDKERAQQALEKAKAQDPDRFTDAERNDIMIKNGAKNLNKYLKDILSKDSDPKEDSDPKAQKRISFRNKNYMVQFGEELKPMFEHLGFKVHQDDNAESFWIPPKLLPQEKEGVTDLRSERAFYEDVRSEVQSYLEENPPSDSPVVKPQASARELIEEALSCKPIVDSDYSPVPENEKQDLRTLGASVNRWTRDSILEYAFERQVSVAPKKSKLFVEALVRLAGQRLSSYNLQEFAATKASLLTTETEPERSIKQAYDHFHYDRNVDFEDSDLIQDYARWRRQNAWQSHVGRKHLLAIGKDRKSDSIVEAAYYADEMDTTEAYNMLSSPPDASIDGIAAQAISSIENDELDRTLAIMALDVISKDRAGSGEDRVFFDNTLSEIRAKCGSTRYFPPGLTNLRNTGYLNSGEDRVPSHNTLSELQATGGSTRNLPPGLTNIGNTCYLNSIVQYLYSVKAVRDLVLKLKRDPLEPNEQKLQALLDRHSSKLKPRTAFVGHEFALELKALFQAMENSTNSFVTPQQRLAEAAVLRPDEMHETSQEAPAVPKPPAAPTRAPPLPPRKGESAGTKVSMEPVLEGSETASDVSSQTLVNQTDDETSSVVVERDAPNPTIKKSKRTVKELAERLNKSDVRGTRQMDLAEVLGWVCEHLSTAFEVEQLENEEPGNVADPIKEAIFSDLVQYHQSITDASTWEETPTTYASVQAWPAAEGSRDIYQALGQSFNLEVMSVGPGEFREKFNTIERPAPNFHIYIQRTATLVKNTNPIDIPDKLYLDRFMDSCHADVEMQRANKKVVDIDTRINELNANRTQGSNGKPASQDTSSVQLEDIDEFLLGEDLGGSAPDREDILTPALKELFGYANIDITSLSETAEHNKVEAGSDDAVGQSEAPIEPSRSDIAEFWNDEVEEMQALVGKKKEISDKMKKEVEYRLHAVFCHRGGHAAGHYWVWIHDFERNDWLLYNDRNVTVHPWEHVHQQISTTGDPYYLAYVRARDISNHVDMPLRRTETHPPTPLGGQTETQSKIPLGPQQQELLGLFRTATPKDTHMDDVEEAPTTEHLEHAPMFGDNGQSHPAPAA